MVIVKMLRLPNGTTQTNKVHYIALAMFIFYIQSIRVMVMDSDVGGRR